MALTERDKRMLMILGVVAALAVVYLFLFVLRGGEEAERVAPPPTETGTPTVPPPTPTETPRPTSPPIDLIADRDPFSIPPGLSPTPAVSPTPTGTPSPTPTGTPSPTPTGTPTLSPTPSPTPPPTTDQIIIGGHDVRLLSVFAKRTRVQVEVDGRVWTVEEGAIFADVFKLEKVLDDRCVRFLYGDQAFELCAQARK